MLRPGWGEKAVLGPGPWKNQIRSYFCHRRLPLEAQIGSKAYRGESERALETLPGVGREVMLKTRTSFCERTKRRSKVLGTSTKNDSTSSLQQ